MIGLTDTNLHWKRHHVTCSFKRILQETWLEDKIETGTSKSSILGNSDYKPGETAMITLNKPTSVIIYKGQDPSDMERWIFMTLSGKQNSRTIVFTIDHEIVPSNLAEG